MSHIIEINNLTPDTRHLSPEAQRELAAQIAASPIFERAPRLRSFLTYIVDRASSGRLDELSEQHIGYEVFRRDSDYDTTTDTIVRSSARQLRAKLIEYYAGQGAASDWVLDIPKGGYLPRFHPRLAISTVIPPVAPSAPPSWKANYWPWVSLILALTLLAVLVRGIHPTSPETPFSVLCLEGNRRLKVLVADAGLILYTGLTGRTPPLQEYVDHKLSPPAWWPDEPQAAHFFEILADRKNTDWAAVASLTAIHRAHPDAIPRLEPRHTKLFHLREMAGENLLLLGGATAIPWALQFERDLNFQHLAGPTFLNRSPRPGEPKEYLPQDRHGLRGRGYTRISAQPLGHGTGRAIHVSGSSWIATEMGLHFLTDPQNGAVLTAQLGENWRRPEATLELMIETEAVESSPGAAKLVAWRFTMPPQRGGN